MSRLPILRTRIGIADGLLSGLSRALGPDLAAHNGAMASRHDGGLPGVVCRGKLLFYFN
jgi:hypothetical protein